MQDKLKAGRLGFILILDKIQSHSVCVNSSFNAPVEFHASFMESSVKIGSQGLLPFIQFPI